MRNNRLAFEHKNATRPAKVAISTIMLATSAFVIAWFLVPERGVLPDCPALYLADH